MTEFWMYDDHGHWQSLGQVDCLYIAQCRRAMGHQWTLAATAQTMAEALADTTLAYIRYVLSGAYHYARPAGWPPGGWDA